MDTHGLEFSFWKRQDREALALVEPDGTEHSVGELQDAAHAVARGLRALGLQPGDAVAMCLRNSAAVYQLMLATSQAGLYLVPLNWHGSAEDMAYILADSEAKALVVQAEQARHFAGPAHAALPRFVVGAARGEEPEGFDAFSTLTDGDATPLDDRRAGLIMNYTSGTTGRPKGVRRPLPPVPPEPVATSFAFFLLMFGMRPGEGVHLVVAPLYHTAVLYFSASALHLGQVVVIMDKWTPEGMLERVERYRVTNSHMVPTHFVRLLHLEDRERYDASSLSHVVHGAAPCPPEVKRRMLAWWGPVISEYYAATEGGGTMVTAEEWLARPGTVGRPWQGAHIKICDDEGQELAPGEVGTVYIKMQQGFEYHKDKAKTAKAWRVDGYFTVGDAGYLDEEGYLFLCDRKADLIISGGVNIYPAEIEAVLLEHPDILDVAVFGVPDEDWGERVHAVVELAEPAEDPEAASAALLAWSTERLAGYKRPRALELIEAMPRDPNGKLAKRKLRDPHWEAVGRHI